MLVGNERKTKRKGESYRQWIDGSDEGKCRKRESQKLRTRHNVWKYGLVSHGMKFRNIWYRYTQDPSKIDEILRIA